MVTRPSLIVLAWALAVLGTPLAARAETPAALAAPGETILAEVLAEGAQIYECKADQAGKLVWAFREPIATLLRDGKTVGRHYAGPHWQWEDGSIVEGRVVARAPGATPNDIVQLKLEAASHSGAGLFARVTTIQRLDTQGGNAEGPCERAGAFLSVAYSARYVFLAKP